MPTYGLTADNLVDSLGLLRKGEGFTQRRLAHAGALRVLLTGNETDSFGRMRSRFISAIHSLDEREADLLMDVYALSPESEHLPLLRDRRQLHAAKIRRGVDTVADREKPALQHLLSTLVTGRYAQSPLTIDVPEMHNGTVYETTSTMLIVQNRLWRETREHYRFVATFDEMDYLTITRTYSARASTAADGAFRVNTRETSHGFNDHFWHRDTHGADTPMRRGEAYDLKFLLQPEDFEHQTPIRNAYRAFHERSLLASIHVAFIGEQPTTIWKYERVSPFNQPGHPNEYNHIDINKNGIATLRLRDLYGGLASGIAWTWA